MDKMEQGWYWLSNSLRVALWTRCVSRSKTIPANEFTRLMEETEKATKSAASIVGFKPQWIIPEVTSHKGQPAALVTAQLLARPEDMEGLEEGRP